MTKYNLRAAAANQAAALCVADKLRFTLRGLNLQDVERLYLAKLVPAIARELNWSEDYTRRHVTAHLNKGSAERGGPITIVQVDYRAARLLHLIPPSWWEKVSEIGAKYYIDLALDKDYDAFINAIDSCGHNMAAHIQRPSTKGNKSKGSTRRWSAGSGKASLSFDLYMRPGEAIGLGAELRAEGLAAVRSRVADVLRYGAVNDPGIRGRIYLETAARAAFGKLFETLSKAGFPMGEWVVWAGNEIFPFAPTSTGEYNWEPFAWDADAAQPDMFALDAATADAASWATDPDWLPTEDTNFPHVETSNDLPPDLGGPSDTPGEAAPPEKKRRSSKE